MPVRVCPAAIVAAPVEDVWELLAQPFRYGEWWDLRVERIVPEGPAVEGQTIYGTSSEFGKRWQVRFVIKKINPVKHRILPIEPADSQSRRESAVAGSHSKIQFDTFLPLGIVAHNTITCTSIDAASCRVQYG